MTPPRPSVFQLAERLQAYGDEQYEVPELSAEECKELDSIVFECSGCNQWFHQRDNATKNGAEWFCADCAEDR